MGWLIPHAGSYELAKSKLSLSRPVAEISGQPSFSCINVPVAASQRETARAW
jgi:hypothetical protein